jgi:hypothetical protein
MAAADEETDQQTLFADDFFYFFLRLRKSRIRQVVERVKRLYPDETPEQQARRLIKSMSRLSAGAGTVFHLPALIPGVGPVYEGLGFVGGASALVRMHLYLVLEIAALFGHDIDHPTRTREMGAVVAACACSAALPPALLAVVIPGPLAVAAGGLGAAVASRVIGERAIRRYKRMATPWWGAAPEAAGE